MAKHLELEINKSQIKKIKQIAHHLKPEFNIGKDGITDAFIASLLQGFNTKEVIKIKILEAAFEDEQTIKDKLITPETGLKFIQKVGHVVTLYRPLEDAK